jgi:hypothetical protein
MTLERDEETGLPLCKGGCGGIATVDGWCEGGCADDEERTMTLFGDPNLSIPADPATMPRDPRPHTGDKLPNGATVIHATEGRGEAVVLAHTDGPQPWVTWSYMPGWTASTGGGHYFDNLADAADDYRSRGGDTTR